MIEVRKARLSDVPKLIPIAKEFFDESEWKNTFGYTSKENDTMFWLASAVKNPIYGFFVAENGGVPVGLLIGYLNIWAMNLMERCAFELFFYVDKTHRNGRVSKKLVEAYEGWARENGCQAVEFGVTEKLRGAKMSKFLERLGYAPALRSHVKRLEVQSGT